MGSLVASSLPAHAEIKPEATSGTRVSFEVDLKAWGASDSDIKKAVGGVMETNGYSVVFEDEVGQIEQHDFGDLIEGEVGREG